MSPAYAAQLTVRRRDGRLPSRGASGGVSWGEIDTDILREVRVKKQQKVSEFCLEGGRHREPLSSHQDQAFFVSAGHGFGARGCAELAQDGADVKLHGVFRDVKAGGDFLVSRSLRQQRED